MLSTINIILQHHVTIRPSTQRMRQQHITNTIHLKRL